jgi:hypothetical protein
MIWAVQWPGRSRTESRGRQNVPSNMARGLRLDGWDTGGEAAKQVPNNEETMAGSGRPRHVWSLALGDKQQQCTEGFSGDGVTTGETTAAEDSSNTGEFGQPRWVGLLAPKGEWCQQHNEEKQQWGL